MKLQTNKFLSEEELLNFIQDYNTNMYDEWTNEDFDNYLDPLDLSTYVDDLFLKYEFPYDIHSVKTKYNGDGYTEWFFKLTTKPKMKKITSESKLITIIKKMIREELQLTESNHSIKTVKDLAKYLKKRKYVSIDKSTGDLEIILGDYENEDFDQYIDTVDKFYRKYKTTLGVSFDIGYGDDVPNTMTLKSNFDCSVFSEDDLDLLEVLMTL